MTPETAAPRRYPKRPIVGVGAVILKDDAVLLVERGREPLKGYWSLPGGVLEVGERIEDAVRREVAEETGLEVRVCELVQVFERIMKDSLEQPEYHYVLLDYRCEAVGGELRAGDDVSQVRWVAREAADKLQLTEGSLPVIDRAFALREGC